MFWYIVVFHAIKRVCWIKEKIHNKTESQTDGRAFCLIEVLHQNGCPMAFRGTVFSRNGSPRVHRILRWLHAKSQVPKSRDNKYINFFGKLWEACRPTRPIHRPIATPTNPQTDMIADKEVNLTITLHNGRSMCKCKLSAISISGNISISDLFPHFIPHIFTTDVTPASIKSVMIILPFWGKWSCCGWQ